MYTSTTNVIFCGDEIHNGDESLPYAPDDRFVDHYSRTKATAERAVLQANGTRTADGRTLYTCALRPAGIYGEGEERHLPRIVRLLEAGLYSFTIGQATSKCEFVYVDNLVDAHILAAVALAERRPPGRPVAAGQSYFVSDCEPINNFDFFRPLVEGLGHGQPRVRIPMRLAYYAAFLIELVHRLVAPVYNFQPLLTRAEVYKVGVTHYFKIDKARTELGYVPRVPMAEGMRRVVAYYVRSGHGAVRRPCRRCLFVAILTVAVLAVAGWALYALAGPLAFAHRRR